MIANTTISDNSVRTGRRFFCFAADEPNVFVLSSAKRCWVGAGAAAARDGGVSVGIAGAKEPLAAAAVSIAAEGCSSTGAAALALGALDGKAGAIVGALVSGNVEKSTTAVGT